jgi:hypothetical protein
VTVILRQKFIGTALAGLVTSAVLAMITPGAAYAASQFASKNNFDNTSRTCDAIVGVSDETTSGSVEVYGGFSCQTGTGLWNQPEAATIRVRLFMNGQEVIQSKKTLATCIKVSGLKVTCSTDSHQVTYPDNSGNQQFYGKIEIVSFSGNATLTTPSITT